MDISNWNFHLFALFPFLLWMLMKKSSSQDGIKGSLFRPFPFPPLDPHYSAFQTIQLSLFPTYGIQQWKKILSFPREKFSCSSVARERERETEKSFFFPLSHRERPGQKALISQGLKARVPRWRQVEQKL